MFISAIKWELNLCLEQDSNGHLRNCSIFTCLFAVSTSQHFLHVCFSPQKDFMSVELSEGKVKVNFDLGSGAGSATSANRHNDGRWKSLTMSRNKKRGMLREMKEWSSEVGGETCAYVFQ